MLDDDLTVRGGVELFSAGGAGQARRPCVQGEVLATKRDLVQHRERVVDVGECIDPGQPLACTARQGLEAVASALRLGPECPVGFTSGCDVRQLIDR